MAKSRAQRKAERRAREAAQEAGSGKETGSDRAERKAQHDTQVGKSGEVAEVEAVEAGIAAGAGEEQLETPDAPKSRIDRRAEKREAKEAERRAKAEARRREREELDKRQKKATQDTRRGGIIGFLISCWAELKRVQWPDRDTLVQATAVTVVFVFVAAAYLGALDAVVNWVVQRVL